MAIAASIAAITMATTSSIRVKPWCAGAKPRSIGPGMRFFIMRVPLALLYPSQTFALGVPCGKLRMRAPTPDTVCVMT